MARKTRNEGVDIARDNSWLTQAIKRIWPDGERDTTGMPTYGLSGKNVLGEAITSLQQLIWVHAGRICVHLGAALPNVGLDIQGR